jgi:hypothetical protein
MREVLLTGRDNRKLREVAGDCGRIKTVPGQMKMIIQQVEASEQPNRVDALSRKGIQMNCNNRLCKTKAVWEIGG